MINKIGHRGPDAQGIYCAGPVGLAHARLSILDLQGGAQPMSTTDGRYWITFNGEIFNYIELREELIQKGHTFLTHCDTEVLLHMYQEEAEGCVERLNGQWAFAIWDSWRRRLFLSRDRLGVRPLFYTTTPESFFFASEVKSLLTQPGVDSTFDLQALRQIFTFWVTLPPRTAFRAVSQLPPGHSLLLENGVAKIWRYWQLEYSAEKQEHSQQLVEELLALLVDATRIRLRSDVPVGAYLSGGLDSTLIAALAKQAVGERLRTFSISFEDSEFDESRYQDEASARLDTVHSRLTCSTADVARVFPDVVWSAEQPLVRTAPAPLYLLSRLTRDSGYKVVLTGEGADEFFGGYDIFKEAKIRRFCGRHPDSTLRPLLLKRLYPYMDGLQRQSPASLLKFFHVSDGEISSPLFSHLPRWALASRLNLILSEAARAEMASQDPLAELQGALPQGFRSWDTFNQAEYLEAGYLLPGYILSSQGDRVAMAHAVEARYPFLDYRVVQFANRLSPTLKMKVLNQKFLLKQAAAAIVPDTIRRRHKQPYRAPDGKAFFSASFPYVDDLLSPSRVKQEGIFNPSAITALLQKFKNGRDTSASDNILLVAALSTQILADKIKCNSFEFSTDQQRIPMLAAEAGPVNRPLIVDAISIYS
jgi:asparagine synthase (glutamine-hydrolysing)